MTILTADLCDKYPDIPVATPIFKDFGGKTTFSGPIVTVKTFHDYTHIRDHVRSPGDGRVLVVDGAGSMDHALMGGNLASAAAENGWHGIIIHGAIRDAEEIAAVDLGVKALGLCPRRPTQDDQGQVDVLVTFAGLTFRPGQWVYCDVDGIVLADSELSL